MLRVEKPIESKYQKYYTISKCYCAFVSSKPEHKGFVWLRRMVCLCEGCLECQEGRFLDCKDPSGKCGPWVKCRLIQARPYRERIPEVNSVGLGPKITVNILI